MAPVEPIDLTLLQTFRAIATSGSVTAAARAIGRSQPAVSQRIQQLEEFLGVPLFEKVGRRLQLTEFGQRLEHESANLLSHAREVVSRVNASTEISGTIRIGSLPTATAHLLVHALRTLIVEHPQLNVELEFGLVADLHRELVAGRIDLALTIGDTRADQFDATQLGHVRIAAAFAPHLSPTHCGTITVKELRQLRYLAWSGRPDPTFDKVRAFANSKGLLTANTPLIPHIETLRELAIAGAGFTLVPDYTVRNEVADKRLVAPIPHGLGHGIPVTMLLRPQTVMTPSLSRACELISASVQRRV